MRILDAASENGDQLLTDLDRATLSDARAWDGLSHEDRMAVITADHAATEQLLREVREGRGRDAAGGAA
jgi:hypothetical protein